MRIALFATCLADTMRPTAPQAVVRLLERLGHEVVFPDEQTCCGQMHFNSGYRPAAKQLAAKVAQTFPAGRYDAIVAPSGSCAGMVRHSYATLSPELPPVPMYELSELLIDLLKVSDVDAYFPHRVTYHPTCHSLRVLRVGDKPLQLLRAVKGIELIELPESQSCCGFGGTFSVKNGGVSSAMLADKCSAVEETKASALCASDASCLMHIGGGLDRLRTGVHTVHLAEILASTEEDPWLPERVR